VDPVSRRRLTKIEEERTLHERVKQLRESKLRRGRRKAPESLQTLVRQGVYLEQIADMLEITEEEVLQRCDEEQLPHPPSRGSAGSMRSPYEPPLDEAVARQFAADEAEGRRRLAESGATRDALELAASEGLSLEQQIAKLHEEGYEAADIAAELSNDQLKVSRQKVQAVIKRYQEDPAAIG